MQYTYNCTLFNLLSRYRRVVKVKLPPPLHPRNIPVHNIQEAGWAPRALQDGCKKSCPTPILCPQTVQPIMRCPTNYSIMTVLDAITGTVFIVDAFNVGHIFLSLHITHRSISPLSQHTTLCICTVRSFVFF